MTNLLTVQRRINSSKKAVVLANCLTGMISWSGNPNFLCKIACVFTTTPRYVRLTLTKPATLPMSTPSLSITARSSNSSGAQSSSSIRIVFRHLRCNSLIDFESFTPPSGLMLCTNSFDNGACSAGFLMYSPATSSTTSSRIDLTNSSRG